MAGTYPDAPALRIPYDRDGTTGFNINPIGGVITVVANSVLMALNDEDSDIANLHGGYGGNVAAGLVFPAPVDILGVSILGGPSDSMTTPETSVNTTNGQDGTWVARTGINTAGETLKPTYRTAITTVSWLGITGLRWYRNNPYYDYKLYALNLYGNITSGYALNRLRIWHPTIDVEVGGPYFDWADIRQSTSADRPFRLKNNSSTLTASTITVSVNAPTDTTPSVAGQHLLSKASVGTFAATVALTSLAPGAISEVLTLRRVTPVGATLGTWSARILASATTWA